MSSAPCFGRDSALWTLGETYEQLYLFLTADYERNSLMDIVRFHI